MSRSILAILLVFSLVFAGCSSVGFGESEPSTATLTPASVPTDEPTPTPVPQLAPGLKRNNLDVDTLVHAHNTTLQNTSYTRKTVRTARLPNGTLFSQTIATSRVGQNGTISTSFNRTNVRAAIEVPKNVSLVTDSQEWIKKEQAVSKATYTNNTTQYTERSLRSGELGTLSGYLTGTRFIQTAFSGTESRVVDTASHNGTTLYIVNSTVLKMPGRGPPGVSASDQDWIFKNLSQANQQALISTSGVVHRYRGNYEIALGNKTLDLTTEIRYTDIGSTTVERPSWYDKASNTSDTQTAMRVEQDTEAGQ